MKNQVSNPYARAGKIQNAQDRRNLKVRKFMSRRKAPDANPYVWAIGYNNISARFSNREAPMLSGSSLNRKHRPHGSQPQQKKKTTDEYAMLNTTALVRKAGVTYYGFLGLGDAFVRTSEPGLAPAETEDSDGQGGQPYRVSASISQSELLLRIPAYQLSSRSRAKIRDKITAFFRAAGRSRTFATLTFIEKLDDGTAVEILNKFLTQLRKAFHRFEYIWVAERQENGNIHFHMMLNKFLPVGRWNAMWVIAQYNSGLRGTRENDTEITYEEILDLYRKDATVNFKPTVKNPKTGKKVTHMQLVLNPFDIREVKSVDLLSSYLTKYVTGQPYDTFFACRPWHSSRGVSRLFTKQLTTPSTFRYMNSIANYWVDKTTGEMNAPKTIRGAFWVVTYVCNKRVVLPFLKRMEQANKWLLAGLSPDGLEYLDDRELVRIYNQYEYT